MSKVDTGLVVVSGCMFAGKTTELMRQITLEEYAKHRVQVFKPLIDTRYSDFSIASHTGGRLQAEPVPDSMSILDIVRKKTQVVGIDEVQFFDAGIVEVCGILVCRGLRVIVAGLPLDFRGEDFGEMPRLLARAEEVITVHARCTVCGEKAYRTQRLVNGEPACYEDPIVLIGANESYEARCRKHHFVPRR